MDLEHAGQCEQQGDFATAESVYRQLLRLNPQDTQVLRRLAANLWQQKRLTEATALLGQATQHAPRDPELYSLLGILLASQGQTSAAIETLQKALAIDPNRAGDHYNVGNLYARSEAYSEAIDSLRRAVELRPDFAEAHFNLGNQLRRQRDFAAAVGCYERAIAVRAGYEKAQNNLSSALLQLGERHLEQGQFDAAIAAVQRATQLAPTSAPAWAQLGTLLAGGGHHVAAIDAYERAVTLRPEFASAHVNLGVSYQHQQDLASAERSFRTALQLDPELVAAHCNLAAVLIAQGQPTEALHHCRSARRYDPDFLDAALNEGIALVELGLETEAEECYQRLLVNQPQNPVMHHNLAVLYSKQALWNKAEEHTHLALAGRPDYAEAHSTSAALKLGAGNMVDGWAEYEWRWKCSDFVGQTVPASGSRGASKPSANVLASSNFNDWDGSSLVDRTILLRAEQGLGDTLQFIRLARLLKRPGVCVLLECQRPLHKLLSTSQLKATLGIDQLIPEGDRLPSFDCFAHVMSLPHRLGLTLGQLPIATNYLAADQTLVRQWQQVLAAHSGFRIGICWQSNVANQRLKYKSFQLAEFEPLARIPGVQLISLQKHQGSDQVSAVRERFSVVDLGPGFDEEAGAFMDTAAVIRNLDLIVCCDSAVGHLAGALGVETWLVLPNPADWRWLRQRTDSPWYPRHRLFRQTIRGDWSTVFQRMAHQLHERFATMGAP